MPVVCTRISLHREPELLFYCCDPNAYLNVILCIDVFTFVVTADFSLRVFLFGTFFDIQELVTHKDSFTRLKGGETEYIFDIFL